MARKTHLKLPSQIAAQNDIPFDPTIFKKKPGSKYRIYVRVSTHREEMISPDLQIAACRRRGTELGLEEYGEPIFDDGLSGADFSKRRVGEMIGEVEAGLYNVIIVWKVSRWGRSLLDSLLNINQLLKVNGGLESATEDLGQIDTAQGKLSLNFLLMMAELQLMQIRDGWIAAHERRIGLALPHSGGARFGYDYGRSAVSDQGLDDSVTFRGYRPNDMAPVLAAMYRDYVNGRTFRAIATGLNEVGITGQTGAAWTHSSVRQVLDSGFGAGYIKYRGQLRKGAHEAVVPEEVFEQYVLKRGESMEMHPRSLGQEAILKRMVWCEVCQRRMALCRRKQTKGGKTYVYNVWRCAGDKGCGGGGQTISNEILEAATLDWVRQNAEGAGDPSEAIARKAKSQAVKKDADKVAKELKQTNDKLDQLLIMRLGKPDQERYDRMEQALQADVQRLETELATLRREERVADLASSEVFGSLYAAWGLVDVPTMNATLGNALAMVLVKPLGRKGKGSAEETAARIKIVPRYYLAEQEAA